MIRAQQSLWTDSSGPVHLQKAMFVRILPLGLGVLAVACILIAALTPVSRQKGRIRLAGSICIGVAFLIGSVSQILKKGKSIPALFGTLSGVFLVWVGLRKYRRGPEAAHRQPRFYDARVGLSGQSRIFGRLLPDWRSSFRNRSMSEWAGGCGSTESQYLREAPDRC